MKALNESIEHWERILQFVKDVNIASLRKEGWNGDSCACCAEFVAYDCDGCPIKAYTGEADCLDTPWWSANAALWAMLDNQPMINEVAELAVTEEINFLKNIQKDY